MKNVQKFCDPNWWLIQPKQEGLALGVYRDPEKLQPYQGGKPNKVGTTPVEYELNDRGALTDWIRYRCECQQLFWSREGTTKTGVCPKCVLEKSLQGGRRLLDLQGKRYGDLEVVRHVKGEGWEVKCRCGNVRTIVNSTALGKGIYKTCGQCSYEERAAASPMAPPSALRAPVVAGINTVQSYYVPVVAAISERLDNARIIGTAIDRGEFTECSLDHAPILFNPALHPDGCPVCLRSAQIELQSM